MSTKLLSERHNMKVSQLTAAREMWGQLGMVTFFFNFFSLNRAMEKLSSIQALLLKNLSLRMPRKINIV